MTKRSLARAKDHVERAIALCDRLGESLFGNARKSAFLGGAGPLPLPTTQSGYAMGGREGERAGTACARRAHFQKDSETAAVAHLQLGLDTLERAPRPLLLATDATERE